MEIKQYVKKPIPIQAVRWEDDQNSYISLIEMGAKPHISVESDGTLLIHTPEGTHICPVGNWVAKGIKGEFYSIKDDIFRDSYDEV